jgi:alpha-L-fucosidase
MTKAPSVIFAVGCLVHLCAMVGNVSADEPTTAWKNPIKKLGYLNSQLVEVSPFVLNDRLYLLENHQGFIDYPDAGPTDHTDKGCVRIRDVATGELIAEILPHHSFGTAVVWDDTVYVFAADYSMHPHKREAKQITLVTSKDLTDWSEPQTVMKGENDEILYNLAACKDPDRFVLLYETNDPRWPAFTFKFCESTDLKTWRLIPDALYGTNKYVGGPALYFADGWYYCLYLEALGGIRYETRIARSRDLKTWEEAPADRPFLTFDPEHRNLPRRPPELPETNASDPELCYFDGKTIIYFTGGDQQVCGDLQHAEFNGTPQDLFEKFFE